MLACQDRVRTRADVLRQAFDSQSGRQVWVHAFYIALLSTELPPAATDHRASRSFYGSPWELDSS